MNRSHDVLKSTFPHFLMIRYETEYTPCTGITAVSRQEQQHFASTITIAPWCPEMQAAKEAIENKKVNRQSPFRVEQLQKRCTIYVATPGNSLLYLLGIEGYFGGVNTPYDTPYLKEDTLVFGLAVEEFVKVFKLAPEFVWCADWETVPALLRLRKQHKTVLTLHNTFDECLAAQALRFPTLYPELQEQRSGERATLFGPHKTALEIGIEAATVVTTVNRGFAWGIKNEVIQKNVMAGHLQGLSHRIVGVNNGSFAPFTSANRKLLKLLRTDFEAGKRLLFKQKAGALKSLPEQANALKERAPGKAFIISMGRLVSQKMHDVFAEALRRIFTEDPKFPLLAFFATVGGGDVDADQRFERIRELSLDFPDNVLGYDLRIPYYSQLMTAADYNCMPSLYEPHGGAFEGTVIPIARAVDGLAEQICPLEPDSAAARIAAMWHLPDEKPSGFLFRETMPTPSVGDFKALLSENPPPQNDVFNAMVEALVLVVKRAVDVRLNDHDQYAKLVMAALERQEQDGWQENLDSVFDLLTGEGK